jgi:hypothetical protein
MCENFSYIVKRSFVLFLCGIGAEAIAVDIVDVEVVNYLNQIRIG